MIRHEFNPLTPVLAETGCAENHPEMAVPAKNGRKYCMGTKSPLSLPWVIFVSPIVLLFEKTNKPIKICLLHIFLENSRGPSKKVF